jgi:mono/diheme cytochrome c family protein
MNRLVLIALLAVAGQAEAQAPDGKTLFAKNCAACHQLTGAGIPGAFPALKGNAFVQGDAAAVIATVLKGRGGMPAFGATLDDEKIALAISYIRSAWGNQAGAVAPAMVQAVRSGSGAAAVTKPQDKGTIIH